MEQEKNLNTKNANLQSVLSKISERKLYPLFIAISGSTPKGKTIFANIIAEKLEKDYSVSIFSFSKYYNKDTTDLNSDEINEENINFNKITEDLEEIKKTPSECQIIIVEDDFSLFKEEIRSFFKLKIFLDVDSDERLVSKILSEVERKSLKDILDNYSKKVKPSFEKNILPTKKYADIYITNSKNYELGAEMIKEYIKSFFKDVQCKLEGEPFKLEEVLDRKYKYYGNKILIENDNNKKEELLKLIEKEIRDDNKLTNNSSDNNIASNNSDIENDRKKVIDTLINLLKNGINLNVGTTPNTINVDLFKSGTDENENEVVHGKKNIFYFNTMFNNQKDIDNLKKYLNTDERHNIIICSVILNPKHFEVFSNKQLEKIFFFTIFFTETFSIYEKTLLKENSIFDPKILTKLFKNSLKEDSYFVCQNI